MSKNISARPPAQGDKTPHLLTQIARYALLPSLLAMSIGVHALAVGAPSLATASQITQSGALGAIAHPPCTGLPFPC